MSYNSSANADQMRAFDALPQRIRRFLANANYNYSARDVVNLYFQSLGDDGYVIQVLREEEAKHARAKLA